MGYLVDGKLFDPLKAQRWAEAVRFNGKEYVSKTTGFSTEHEALYLFPDGEFAVERWSDHPDPKPEFDLIDEEEAVNWLLLNDHKLPTRLVQYQELIEG